MLDVAPQRAATVVWRLAGPTEAFLQSSTRPPGGAFAPPVNVNSGKDDPLFHEVSVSDEGDAIVVWSGKTAPTRSSGRRCARRARRLRAAGGDLAEQSDLLHPRPCDRRGWRRDGGLDRSDGTNNIVQLAGYDADPPQLTPGSRSRHGTVADPVQFSASPFDVWPIG